MNENFVAIDIKEAFQIEEKFPEIPLKKYLSLPEKSPERKDESSSFNSLFSHKFSVNRLLRMGFDINVCFKILETSQINEPNPEIFLQILIEKYFNIKKEKELQNQNEEFQQKPLDFLLPLNLNILYDMSHSLKKKIQEKKKAYTFIQKNEDIYIEMSNENIPEIVHPIIDVLELPTTPIFKAQKPQLGDKICPICYEKKEYSLFFTLSPCKDSFCIPCLISYLKEVINSAKLLKIPCPAECGCDLSYADIKSFAASQPDLFLNFTKIRNNLMSSLDPLNRWCINPLCSVIIRNISKKKKIKCEKCKQEMCFDCRGPWHGNMTCEQALDKEIKIYSNVKYCPKCKSRIEKNGGCNHMTCSRCQYQFCWLCKNKYTTNHFDVGNELGCPGMQSEVIQDERSFHRRRCCRLTKYYLKKKLGFLVFPLFFLLVWIVGTFILAPMLFWVYYEPKNLKGYLLTLIIGVLGLPFAPLSMIIIIAPGSCLAYKEYKKRKNYNVGQ